MNTGSLQSVEVPKETLKSFRKYVKSFRFLSAFLRKSRFTRNTTKRILSGENIHPDTLAKIEELLNGEENV